MTPARFTEWREALGGTRCLLTLGAGIVDTGLRIASYIDQSIYAELTFSTVAVFIGGHVYQRVKMNAQLNEPLGDSSDDIGVERGRGGRRKIGVGPSDSEAN